MTDALQPLALPESNTGSRFMHVDTNENQAIGFYFCGKDILEKFFSVACPCGVLHSVGINEFPTVDTPHICGNKNHWFAKFSE